MKKILSLILAAGLLLPHSAAYAQAGASQPAAQAWVSDWHQNIFVDTLPQEGDSLQVRLVTAKNAVEPFSVNVRAAQDGKITAVAFSDLSCGDHVIPASGYSYNFVDHVRTKSNSRYADKTDPDAVLGDWDTKWVNISNPIRKADKDNMVAFPEILSNDRSRVLRADQTQPIWIKLRIPRDAAAGTYTGIAEVRTSLGNFELDIAVEVVDFAIPDPSSKEAFSLEIWSQLVGNFDTDIDVVVDAFGVQVDSEEWWQVMESFAEIMRENRLNVLAVNQTALLLYGENTDVDENGVVTFDFTFFNKFVSFFKEKAGIQQFVCGPLAKYKANPKNYNNDIPGEELNDYTKAYIETIAYSGGTLRRTLSDIDLSALLLGNEAAPVQYIKQYSAALYQNLQEKGWLEEFSHHIIDEPGKDHLASLYPILEKALSDNCPGIRTGDAFTVWTAEEQTAHTEMFAIMESSYEELQDRMAKVLKPGDEFWLYTSNLPMKDNYLNRAIDQPVWFMEMLGYLCFKRNATGYLHWGLNQWNTWTRDYYPFPNYPQDEMMDNVLGDASCVYPDKQRLRLRSSIRVEALREASELYSVLVSAKQNFPQQTTAIVDSLIVGGTEYETDIAKMTQAKAHLLRMAAGRLPEELPAPQEQARADEGGGSSAVVPALGGGLLLLAAAVIFQRTRSLKKKGAGKQ